eukprot:5410484-Pleurochrysis_carterae.AAC.1
MERQLTTTVAEQDRRAEVAAELKAARDRENRAALAKTYRAGKALVEARDELDKTKAKLKESNLLLFESEKRARGLAQKLLCRDRQKSLQSSGSAGEEEGQLKEVSK